jgi:hypothetical protein
MLLRFKSVFVHALWLLPLAILLSLSQSVPGAWAQAGLYSAPVKFTVTSTQLNDQAKFYPKSIKVYGTLQLYLITDPYNADRLIPGQIPSTIYYIQLVNVTTNKDDGNIPLLLGIDKLASVKTHHGQGNTSLKAVGTGTFVNPGEGGATGPVYVDISGTVVKDKHTGNIKQINLTTKAGGGTFIPDNSDSSSTWKATIPATLKLAE